MPIRSLSKSALFIFALLAPSWASAEESENAVYQPMVNYDEENSFKLQIPLSIRARGEAVSAFPVDSAANEFGAPALLPQVRLGALLTSKGLLLPLHLHLEYEHDLLTGTAAGRPDLEGALLPNDQELEQELRKLFLRASLGAFLHLQGGVTTSHWGMGLLANDGAHSWTPGSAQFRDSRSGDRVIRGQIATGPITNSNLIAAFAVDSVLGDDIGLPEDDAVQFIGALKLGEGKKTNGGFYVVRRDQEATDGRNFGIWAFDATMQSKIKLERKIVLTLEGELAVIVGDTDLTGNREVPLQDITQLGAAARATIDFGQWGGVLDFLYATGDRNFDDGKQNAFKADPNYEMGLLLFRQVLGAQSGRAVAVAGDPDLVGVPNTGLERYPSRGSASNTIAFFPRAFWRAFSGFETYGGVLVALAEVEPADPLNTRIAGGSPRNALGGTPGRFLGTELDVGVRYETVLDTTELSAGLEGGLLIPGSALAAQNDGSMDPVVGARLMLGLRM
jgi:hypothetical protein